MTSKAKVRPDVFTSHERFIYLLSELEYVLASGTVAWTPASIEAAKARVDRIAAALHLLAAQAENE